ncbi:hypothetical protein T484DRAFT_1795114, partial [Baffinella frigidus]
NAGVWDPLLASLANFSSGSHLESQIKLVYELLDVDSNGSIDFAEMSDGLSSIRSLKPPILLSLEDFETFSGQGSLIDEHGGMSYPNFHKAMVMEMIRYAERITAQRMQQ